MKPCFILIIGLLSNPAVCLGDIIIYSLTESDRVIGGNSDWIVASKGYWIVDLETGEQRTVGYGSVGAEKHYSISTKPAARASVIGANRVKHLVSIRNEQTETEGGVSLTIQSYGRGTNAGVAIGNGRTISAPKFMHGTSRILRIANATDTAVVEGRLALSFDGIRTRSANNAGKELEQVTTEIANNLASRGYTLIPELIKFP